MSGRMPNVFQNSLMLLLFNNTAIANVGNAGGIQGSTVAGSLYVGLNIADPGAAGTQATNEAAYPLYARQAVARTAGAGGWTVSGSSPTEAQNTAAITFPQCGTYAGETETWFTVGVAASGATVAMFQGPLTSSLEVSTGITPSFPIDNCTCTID